MPLEELLSQSTVAGVLAKFLEVSYRTDDDTIYA